MTTENKTDIAPRPVDINQKANPTIPGSLVRAAISRVMGEVGTVAKDGKNSFHNYNYATAADIAYALQTKMAAAGLLITQNEVELKTHFEDAVLTVSYEFTLSHISGDVVPEKIRKTGASSLKNSKGGVDDKAINKCSTAALKYFLLGLFMIPTGDYDDADKEEDKGGGAPQPRTQRTATPAKAAPEPEKPEEPIKAPFDPETGEILAPHSIGVPLTNGVADPDKWARIYIAALKASPEKTDEWVKLNAKLMGQLSKHSPRAHAAVSKTLDEIRAPKDAAPAEQQNPIAAG